MGATSAESTTELQGGSEPEDVVTGFSPSGICPGNKAILFNFKRIPCACWDSFCILGSHLRITSVV